MKIAKKTHFKTHISNLSRRCNLQVENIEVYCQNNRVSDSMKKRIIAEYNKCNVLSTYKLKD